MSTNFRAYTGMDLRFVRDPIIRAALMAADLFLRDLTRNENLTTDLGAIGGASSAATYVTVAAESALSAERRLTAGTALSLSDGGPNGTISLGATLTTPSIVLGTASAAGVANSMIRSDATIVAFDGTTPADLAAAAGTGSVTLAARRDHVHRFPTSLLSTANLSTLTLTDDGTDQTLTGNLGFLKFSVPGGGGGGYSFQMTGSDPVVVTVVGSAASGQRTLMIPAWTGGALTSETARCWDAQPVPNGIWTTATIIGYDTSNFTLGATATSNAANKGYCARFSGPVISNTNAGFTELAALLLEAPRRSTIGAVVSTLSATGIIEVATVGTTKQTGLTIRQRTAQQTATDRIGIDIETHNSGTNRWSLRAADRVEIQSQAAQAQTALLLRQLSTGATAGAHINFDDKAGNPGAPNTGDLWRNGTSLNYRKDGATTIDLLAAAGGGDSITVNTVAVTDADFDDLTPAAPTASGSFTGLNVRWQSTGASPTDVSSYIGKDLNGNWMLSFSPTGSAVNYIGLVNSATGIGPQILAQGTDSNINLRLGGFGTTGKIMSNTGSFSGSEIVARNMWANHFVMAGI